MKQFILCSILVWACANSFAQTIINGSVSDSKTGEAIPFVTIVNTKTNQGAITNGLGQYSIAAHENSDSLKISYIGYMEITLLAQSSLNIQITPAPLSLDEVVISVNREQEKRTEAPIAISSISTEAIENVKSTTIGQILNQSPGINMVDLGNEQHTMSIRRPIDYGASYLYMEDGIPIRTSGVFNHNALLEINMANTSRIEIIRGPASSIYGSEAIGGAINFISKKPSISPTAGISVQGNDIGYKRTDFYVSTTLKNKLGIRISGYYADQKDGIISHSDFDKLALSLSANYSISDHTELTWSNTFIDYYSDMTGSLDSLAFLSEDYASSQTFTNRRVDAYRTKLSLQHYWNEKSKSTVTGYFRNNSVKQNPSYRVKDDFKPWIPAGNPNLAHGEINDNRFNSYGLVAQHHQKWDWLNSSLVSGASIDFSPNSYDANYIQIHKNNNGIYDSFIETDSALADYSADLLNIAAFSQFKIQPVKGFNVIAGIRFDQFEYKFDNKLDSNAFTGVLDGTNTFNNFTPKLGITYDLKENRGIYANYSRGFVPPQVTELYRGEKIPSLKPVYYDNYEIGGWIAFAKKRAKLDVSIYRMDGWNEIISVLQDDGSRARQNAGKTSHEGIEYGLNLIPTKDVQIRISGTNAIHEFVDFDESGSDFSGNKMPQAPEWIANVMVTYTPSFLKGLRVSAEWRHVDEYYMDQQNSKKYDGYDLFNVRMGYKWKAMEVWVNVINATDELYATVARSSRWGDSYSLGKPRNVNIGLAYKFSQKK